LSFSAEDLYEARRLLRQSLSIDAGYARAYALLSRSYTFAWLSPVDGDFLRSGALEEAYQLARKAIQLDLNLPQAYASLGYALLWLRQPDASIVAFEKAIALNPNYSDPRYAGVLVAAGHPARAISEVEMHMRRDPFYLPVVPVWAGVANYLIERYAEALPLLRDGVLASSEFFPRLRLAGGYPCAIGPAGGGSSRGSRDAPSPPGFYRRRHGTHKPAQACEGPQPLPRWAAQSWAAGVVAR